ncbi:hypothetical protein CFOUR_09605 [Corynebacterium fournieri]|nr:hypothetical protein CFOUR_09605 [Corynebacterium fournieri]
MFRTARTAAVVAAAAFAAVPVAAFAQDLPAQTANAHGEQYFLNEEGSHYVRSLQEAAQPYAQLDSGQQERAVAVADAAVAGLIDAGVIRDQPSDQPAATSATEAAPVPETVSEIPLGADDVDPADSAPVAGGLLKFPPVLTLDGETYFLNKDGHTFVADVTRVNADVTSDETAQSDALVQANAGEVGRQGLEAARAGGDEDVAKQESAATPYAARGLEAATGSNTVVRALFALALAGGLGAAFFAFARRRLV